MSVKLLNLLMMKSILLILALSGLVYEPIESRAAVSQDFAKVGDPVSSRGFKHTTLDRPMVEGAISRANQLLPAHVSRLVPSWLLWSLTSGIPVYLVEAPPTASAIPAAVPRGCLCVFVNPKIFSAWLREQSTGSGRFELNGSNVLTFMLLHEVGHIVNKNPAAEFSNGALAQLNIEPSLAKANEEKADDFAANLIREAARKTPVSENSFEANWVAIELQHLSWNMQANRALDQFGATEIGLPAVFLDQTYSHPNLAWRILRSNDIIHQSPESRELLNAFESARGRAGEQKPIYRKEK